MAQLSFSRNSQGLISCELLSMGRDYKGHIVLRLGMWALESDCLGSQGGCRGLIR